jgi:hypothetical protein
VSAVRRFGHFCWDFVVGDDWTVAVGVVLGLAVTWALTHHGENWFWVMPVVVLSLLAVSLRRLSGRAADPSPASPVPEAEGEPTWSSTPTDQGEVPR